MLTIYAANHLTVLARHLAATVAREPLPPHARETIVVPSQAVGRWLTLELAKLHGVAASCDMPLPTAFARTLSDVAGVTPSADEDLFRRELLAWRIDAVLDEVVQDATAAPLRAYVQQVRGDARARHRLCDALADTCDAYQVYRHDWLAAWEQGHRATDQTHEPWQAVLWRRLVQGSADAHLGRRLEHTLARLRSATPPPTLPSRVLVFAPAALPGVYVDLLEALAQHVEVAVWLHTVRPQWVGDVAGQADATSDDDDEAAQPHPLLAQAARSRRFLRALGSRDSVANGWRELPLIPSLASGVLEVVQNDCAAARDPRTRADKPMIAADDRSLLVHRCHSERRELEVLRDALLGAFAAQPDLTPADVLVLVPDVERYAPLIPAVWGAMPGVGETSGVPALPFTIVDRPATADDPIAAALVAVLRLAAGRRERSAVLALLDLPAVRAAAGFDDDAVERIGAWCAGAGVRWGRDGVQRGQAAQAGAQPDEGTWRAGLDRLLAGSVLGHLDDAVDGIVPVAGDVAGELDVLGRFAAWLGRLDRALDAAAGPHPLTRWRTVCDRIIDDLLVAPDEADGAGLAVRTAVARFDDIAARTGHTAPVDRAVLCERLEDLLTAAPSRRDAAGTITIGALRPQRAVPYKFIAVLGLEDGVFPRRTTAQPFDLVAGDAKPRPGDRDQRGEDRQLFLDLIIAAQERLHLSWCGFSTHSGDAKPPSSCVAELLAALDATFVVDGAQTPAQRLTIDHRLQPFHPAEFAATAAVPACDPLAAAVAGVLSRPRSTQKPFVPADFSGPSAGRATVELGELIAFWCAPARAWCRAALGFDPVQRVDEADADHEPFAVSGLERFAVAEVGVTAALAGRALPSQRLRADGVVPLGQLGRVHLDGLAARHAPLVAHLRACGPSRRAAVQVMAPDGAWRLTGEVGVTDAGLLSWRPGALRTKDRIAWWIATLAWNAHAQQGGGMASDARLVGIEKDAVQELVQSPVPDAVTHLAWLIAQYRAGLVRPLPFHPALSVAIVTSVDKPEFDPEWTFTRGGWNAVAEADDPAISLVWRGRQAVPLPETNELALRFWRGYDEFAPKADGDTKGKAKGKKKA